MNWRNLIDRLKEPSTYAGLSGIALLIGVSSEEFQMYAGAAAGLFAFAAIILKETGNANKNDS